MRTATCAERNDMDAHVMLASLLHDAGTFIWVPRLFKTVSEILRFYERDETYSMVIFLQVFIGRWYNERLGMNL